MNPVEKALNVIASYGWIDGAHHKQWVLDQVARALTETDEGYQKWREQFIERFENDEYDHWEEGIAP